MLPIILDGSNLSIAIVGVGEGVVRRLAMLKAAGITDPVVYSDALPDADQIASLHILFIAGLDEATSRELAGMAHLAGVIVNVEDVPSLCDFHVPAQVRRGDLLLTVSTGGRAPGLSRALREDLQRRFGPEWAERLDEVADLRNQWRAQGLTPNAVSERTQALFSERGWAA
ncbi:MAG TPA: NAD(P)-dependent oxidoreductase [Micropepsaceae bacterium]|nr:NAD(P)-dependent oxidoreductase [Micropepsaceae bacterium]